MKVLRALMFLVILGGWVVAGVIRPAAAQSPADPVSLQVTPTFDGNFKNGEWLAAWAEIENHGKNVEAQLSVQISNSANRATYAVAVSLPAGARKRVPLYILANNYSRELEVQLNGPDGLLARQKITVRPQANLNYFIGLAARERGGLALLNGIVLPGQVRPKVIVDVTLEDLTERMEGLRSFNLLVFNDVDTSRLTPGQAAALADWVFQGGRLVIGGGSGAAMTLAGLPPELLPVTLEGQSELAAEDLTGLVDFSGGSAILTRGTFISSKIRVLGTSRLLAGDQRQPLVVENRYGQGRVDFIPLDLSSAPFNSWPDTLRFWNQLLAPGGEYSKNLPADLSPRQVYSAEMFSNLSNIPALDLPSIQWLSLLLAVYILLVGPVNYLVLRWLRRLQLAWFTIPVLTLVFSAGTFGIGYWLRGSDILLNQIAIVTPNGRGAAAVMNYLGLFSPSQRSYALTVKTPGLLSAMTGYDGNMWGTTQGQSSGSHITFIQGAQPRVSGLSINQWAFQTFAEEERWSQFGSLSADLRLENENVVGTLRNETQIPLTDVSVIVGAHFVRLGDLAIGEEKVVELHLATQMPNQIDMPISYRLYENRLNMNSNEARRLDLKRSLVSRMVDEAGVKFAELQKSLVPTIGLSKGGGTPVATVVAWTDQVPPQVTVEGSQVKKQVIGLVTQKVELTISETDIVTIPTGMIPGSITQSPANGGNCGGSNSTGVMLLNGPSELSYQLPDLKNYRLKELRLSLTRGGLPSDRLEVALYDWNKKSWAVLQNLVFGVNRIGQPEIYMDANRSIRVRITQKANVDGICIFIDLGLTAEKIVPGGG